MTNQTIIPPRHNVQFHFRANGEKALIIGYTHGYYQYTTGYIKTQQQHNILRQCRRQGNKPAADLQRVYKICLKQD